MKKDFILTSVMKSTWSQRILKLLFNLLTRILNLIFFFLFWKLHLIVKIELVIFNRMYSI